MYSYHDVKSNCDVRHIVVSRWAEYPVAVIYSVKPLDEGWKG
jgi:hypothetical protein